VQILICQLKVIAFTIQWKNNFDLGFRLGIRLDLPGRGLRCNQWLWGQDGVRIGMLSSGWVGLETKLLPCKTLQTQLLKTKMNIPH